MGSGVKTVALELQPCCGNRSGVGTYAYELAKRLYDDDEMRFCGNLFNFCGRNDCSEALNGIDMPLNECRLLPYRFYRCVWNCVPISYERLFPMNANLSVFFNYTFPPFMKGKTITTVHDLTYLRFPETMKVRHLLRLKEGMRRIVKQSDKILTVSDFSRKELLELLDIPEDKVVVVCNAPSIFPEVEDFKVVCKKYKITQPYLLFLGTIEPRKNLTRLIHVFDLLKKQQSMPHKLVLGGGKGWRNKEIYQAARNSPYSNDIIFTGYLSNAEKNSLYEHADLFVFPSLYEGFGIPPLEAMHFGCPVVTANAASLPEVCGDAAVFVNPLDEQDISKGIWKVLSDKDYALELRKKGFQQEKKYTWESSAERLRAVCAEVLNE